MDIARQRLTNMMEEAKARREEAQTKMSENLSENTEKTSNIGESTERKVVIMKENLKTLQLALRQKNKVKAKRMPN